MPYEKVGKDVERFTSSGDHGDDAASAADVEVRQEGGRFFIGPDLQKAMSGQPDPARQQRFFGEGEEVRGHRSRTTIAGDQVHYEELQPEHYSPAEDRLRRAAVDPLASAVDSAGNPLPPSEMTPETLVRYQGVQATLRSWELDGFVRRSAYGYEWIGSQQQHQQQESPIENRAEEPPGKENTEEQPPVTPAADRFQVEGADASIFHEMRERLPAATVAGLVEALANDDLHVVQRMTPDVRNALNLADDQQADYALSKGIGALVESARKALGLSKADHEAFTAWTARERSEERGLALHEAASGTLTRSEALVREWRAAERSGRTVTDQQLVEGLRRGNAASWNPRIEDGQAVVTNPKTGRTVRVRDLIEG